MERVLKRFVIESFISFNWHYYSGRTFSKLLQFCKMAYGNFNFYLLGLYTLFQFFAKPMPIPKPKFQGMEITVNILKRFVLFQTIWSELTTVRICLVNIPFWAFDRKSMTSSYIRYIIHFSKKEHTEFHGHSNPYFKQTMWRWWSFSGNELPMFRPTWPFTCVLYPQLQICVIYYNSIEFLIEISNLFGKKCTIAIDPGMCRTCRNIITSWFLQETDVPQEIPVKSEYF